MNRLESRPLLAGNARNESASMRALAMWGLGHVAILIRYPFFCPDSLSRTPGSEAMPPGRSARSGIARR